MRGKGGFTLIELLVVLALIAILAGIGFSLDGWENKFRAESEVKQIYSDLMKTREEAMAQKSWYFVEFQQDAKAKMFDYKIYQDTNGDGAFDNGVGDTHEGPYWQLGNDTYLFVDEGQATFTLGVSPDGLLINPNGAVSPTLLVSWTPDGAATVNTDKAPQLNCISWTATSISLGSWEGTPNNGTCTIN